MRSLRYKPDPGQFGALVSLVLLAFALTHLLDPVPTLVAFPLLGIRIEFELDLGIAVVLLTSILAAAGVDWLLRSHPTIQPGETVEHWLMPMLTVLVLGITLQTLPGGTTWWLGFSAGGVLLALIFQAEFIAVDTGDVRYGLASSALNALSFALFFILAIALHATGVRLFLLLPALFLGAGLIALRSMHLRLNETWEYSWAAGIALISVQFGAAFHYWPVTSIRFGLLLLGPLYALVTLAVSLIEGRPFRRAVVEPLVMLGLLWGLAILVR